MSLTKLEIVVAQLVRGSLELELVLGASNHWDVRNGLYYEDSEPYRIVKLTKTEFDYASTKDIGVGQW